MKSILKRGLVGLAGGGAMVLLVLVAAPTAVRSAVTTFVSVVGNVSAMNPNDPNTGFPMPLLTKDYDQAAHTASMTTQTCAFGAFGCQTPGLRAAPNSAAVLQDISGTCTFQGTVSGDDVASIELLFGDPSNSAQPTHPVYFSPTSEVSSAAGKTIYFGRPVYYVLNEVTEPATLDVALLVPGSGSCTVTYSGYNIDTHF